MVPVKLLFAPALASTDYSRFPRAAGQEARTFILYAVHERIDSRKLCMFVRITMQLKEEPVLNGRSEGPTSILQGL